MCLEIFGKGTIFLGLNSQKIINNRKGQRFTVLPLYVFLYLS
jgi:hypothetical protein